MNQRRTMLQWQNTSLAYTRQNIFQMGDKPHMTTQQSGLVLRIINVSSFTKPSLGMTP